MPLPLYLAMTASEISTADKLPAQVAYMACHFSPYGTGLCNFPQSIPPGSMLILNDSTPAVGHEPDLIARQLNEVAEAFHCSCILLDLQRPYCELTFQIAERILMNISCPVAVSEEYAAQLKCPVFLSAPPANRSLQEHLAPWRKQKIWLEAAQDAKTVTVSKSGSRTAPVYPLASALLPHQSEQLHCHYKIEPEQKQVCFTLQRTTEDLKALLKEAENLGVVGAVGLYQELGAEFYPL